MANSRRFSTLVRRIAQLEKGLLPPVKPGGGYSVPEQDRIRGFRILVHAEIEAFLEEIVTEIVLRSYTRYKGTGRANKVLKAIGQTFCREHTPTLGKDFFEYGVKKFQDAVKRNHGIKEKNVCGLFLAIGFGQSLLDITWLTTMSSFGEKRGQVAHNSFRVATVPDPVTEKNEVQQLMTGLKTFDENLVLFRRKT